MARKRRKVSSRPPSASLRPAPWYGKLTETARAKRVYDLKDGVRLARKFFTGFAPSDGYDLRHPERFSHQKVKRILDHARYIHYLQSAFGQTSKQVRVLTSRSRRALRSHTGQHAKNQKRFFVPVSAPENSSVRITRTGKVEVVRHLKDRDLVQRYYTYRDIVGRQPVTREEFLESTREMLKRMPKGTYSLLGPQGPFHSPMPKKDILLNIQTIFVEGDSGGPDFFETIIGFLQWSSRREGEQYHAAKRRAAEQREKIRKKKLANRKRFIRMFTHRGRK